MYKVEQLAEGGRLTITQGSEAVGRLPGGQAESASGQPGVVARDIFAQVDFYSPPNLYVHAAAALPMPTLQ